MWNVFAWIGVVAVVWESYKTVRWALTVRGGRKMTRSIRDKLYRREIIHTDGYINAMHDAELVMWLNEFQDAYLEAPDENRELTEEQKQEAKYWDLALGPGVSEAAEAECDAYLNRDDRPKESLQRFLEEQQERYQAEINWRFLYRGGYPLESHAVRPWQKCGDGVKRPLHISRHTLELLQGTKAPPPLEHYAKLDKVAIYEEESTHHGRASGIK